MGNWSKARMLHAFFVFAILMSLVALVWSNLINPAISGFDKPELKRALNGKKQ